MVSLVELQLFSLQTVIVHVELAARIVGRRINLTLHLEINLLHALGPE